jgi:hypothetical protein
VWGLRRAWGLPSGWWGPTRWQWVSVLIAITVAAAPGCGTDRQAAALPAPPPRTDLAVRTTAQADAEQKAAWAAPLPFRVPAGYVAERVAAEPLVKHPMFAAFDERGRLFVAGVYRVAPEPLEARGR